MDRITNGHAAMRVPVEATDPDVVLADCKDFLLSLDAPQPTRTPIANITHYKDAVPNGRIEVYFADGKKEEFFSVSDFLQFVLKRERQ